MATTRPRTTARRGVRRATTGAKRRRTVSSMPRKTRTARSTRAGGTTKRTRVQLYAMARRRNIPGRSKMNRRQLARALGEL